MALEIKVHSGVVARWDAVHHGKRVSYAALEFEDGKRLGQFLVNGELNAIFEEALKAGLPVEMHMITEAFNAPSALVAFSESGGRLFAAELPPVPERKIMWVALALCILLMPVFGVGLIPFGMWVRARRQIQPFIDLRKYVHALPGVTMVKT
jgi:hypothetical protein